MSKKVHGQGSGNIMKKRLRSTALHYRASLLAWVKTGPVLLGKNYLSLFHSVIMNYVLIICQALGIK